MAELPELRAHLLPERPEPPRPLYDRPHSYGVTRELDRMKEGWVPPPRTPRIRTRDRRRLGPWAAFRGWSASWDRGPAHFWHRMRCRTGHHDLRGGHIMQLGSRPVYVERRCLWCDAQPGL